MSPAGICVFYQVGLDFDFFMFSENTPSNQIIIKKKHRDNHETGESIKTHMHSNSSRSYCSILTWMAREDRYAVLYRANANDA